MWGLSSRSVRRFFSKRSRSSRVSTEKVTEMVMEASSKHVDFTIKMKGWVGFRITLRTFSLFTFSKLLPWTVISYFFCLSSQLNLHSLFFQGGFNEDSLSLQRFNGNLHFLYSEESVKGKLYFLCSDFFLFEANNVYDFCHE